MPKCQHPAPSLLTEIARRQRKANPLSRQVLRSRVISDFFSALLTATIPSLLVFFGHLLQLQSFSMLPFDIPPSPAAHKFPNFQLTTPLTKIFPPAQQKK